MIIENHKRNITKSNIRKTLNKKKYIREKNQGKKTFLIKWKNFISK